MPTKRKGNILTSMNTHMSNPAQTHHIPSGCLYLRQKAWFENRCLVIFIKVDGLYRAIIKKRFKYHGINSAFGLGSLLLVFVPLCLNISLEVGDHTMKFPINFQ